MEYMEGFSVLSTDKTLLQAENKCNSKRQIFFPSLSLRYFMDDFLYEPL